MHLNSHYTTLSVSLASEEQSRSVTANKTNAWQERTGGGEEEGEKGLASDKLPLLTMPCDNSTAWEQIMNK